MNKIFIPKRLRVGFQNRDDCFSGKLAYIIYYDDKNKLRKAVSYNNWIDSKIVSVEYDNIPTTNLSLNKKVGGDSYGWHYRQSYVRLHDPIRDYDFEITPENLLFILKQNNCIDNVLSGEYIFGYDKDKLVLLPTNCDDYIESLEYTDLKNSKNISSKLLVEGSVYSDYKEELYLYCGYREVYPESNIVEHLSPVKKHLFIKFYRDKLYLRYENGKNGYTRSYGFKFNLSGIKQLKYSNYENYEEELNWLLTKSNLFIKPVLNVNEFHIELSTLKEYSNTNNYIFIKKSESEYIGYRVYFEGKYIQDKIRVIITPDKVEIVENIPVDSLTVSYSLIGFSGYNINIHINKDKQYFPYIYKSIPYIDE